MTHPKSINNRFLLNAGPFLLLAATALLCVLPFFIHDTLFASHDIKFHLFQSAQFYKSVSAGTLVPKWAMEANNGYGSPNFLFYSPLCYYVVSLFHSFIPSLVASIIAAIWSSFFLSGLSMFLMVRKSYGASIGLICGFLYQILPFHVFDLYFRGTLGELFAFIWFPLIFTFLNRFFSSGQKSSAVSGLAICYAGLILTHLVSAFLVACLTISFLILKTITDSNLRNSIAALSSITLGMGIAAYFLLPIMFEMKYVQLRYTSMHPCLYYMNNFLFQFEGLRGLSPMKPLPGDVTEFIDTFSTLFSRLSAPVQWPANVIGLLETIVTLEMALFLAIMLHLYRRKEGVLKEGLPFFSLYMLFLSFFMSTPLSRWLWDLLPQLRATQFPWRWTAYMEVALIFRLFRRICGKRAGNSTISRPSIGRCDMPA